MSDAAMADALAAALMAYGYRALVAHRGDAALQVSQAWAPHVVVRGKADSKIVGTEMQIGTVVGGSTPRRHEGQGTDWHHYER